MSPHDPARGPAARVTARLADEADFAGFRERARALLLAQVAPADVHWQVGEAGDLFGDARLEAPPAPDAAAPGEAMRVSREFLAMCGLAALHAEPGRHALVYRLLWRVRAEPGIAHDVLDADHARVLALARAVSRDMHKMKAFVRFRPVPGDAADAPWRGPAPLAGQARLHVAWFEPEHHIVRAVGGFFMRRFAGMAWAILTPRCSLRWDGRALSVGPGAPRSEAPTADADESLWLTYYRSIFNPARLKLRAMAREMPRRYWRDLPEAALIARLAHVAAQRTAHMLAAEPGAAPAYARAAHRMAARPAPAASPGDGAPLAPPASGEAGLATLSAAVAGCAACPLAGPATQAVCGRGPADAGLMLVGEQPGEHEDLGGEPFIGPAGQLLERAFGELGWERDRLYLTNAVKHFGFELRGTRRMHKTPGQREILACAPWLEQEIALVRPGALVALGATAGRALLGRPVAIARERGRWLRRADGLAVLVTTHPAALLRSRAGDPEGEYRRWLAELRLADAAAQQA